MTCYALRVTTTNTAPVSRRRVYDARVRELVCATGNTRLFPELNIPKSTENVNDTVDKFLLGGILKRVLAQVEIIESNSAIEVWWRGLKNFWLYLNVLDTEAAVRRLVAFYVQQYNELMPHSALDFRTPDEVYFGRTQDLPSQLANARRAAREARVTVNRATSCETCSGSPASSATALSEAA